MTTDFAPEIRATTEEIKQQTNCIASNMEIHRILNAVPESVMILNRERQIIYTNNEGLATLGMENPESLYGLRPGESLQCIHSTKTDGGCGTTRFCRLCGAVKAILESQEGHVAIEECRITRLDTTTAMDLKVKASPYIADDVEYTVLAISDISAEKRKEVLESIFFHDILNTAGGLVGYSELLLEADSEEIDEFKSIIHDLSGRIVEEIKAQRILIQAENGQLQTQPVSLNSLDVLNSIVDSYSKHEVAIDKKIELAPQSESIQFKSDQTLLGRVLGNLVKNALEAVGAGESVKVASYNVEGAVEFQVCNSCVIPENTQLQIFQRSFSTKGSGRGLGTYSIKLLTEKYLQGSIRFVSNEDTGTVFFARYPLVT